MELKKLGQLVNWVDNRNKGLQSTNLLGISIDKFFMPSVANIIGTDLSSYKVISENQFACNPMHVGRDEKMPVSLYMQKECSIVSPAYFVFEVADVNEILPEYLMLWFRRNEFDREVWFHTDGSVRGGILWEELCELIIPVPSLAEQQEIVDAYNDIERRIALKRKINDNLEAQAQTIYKKMFVEDIDVSNLQEGWKTVLLESVAELSAGGDRPTIYSEFPTDTCNVPIFSNGIEDAGLYGFTDKAKIFSESVTVSARGTVGYVFLREEPYVPIVRLISVIPNTDYVTAKYLYFALADIELQSTGTSQQQITVPDFKNRQILVPDRRTLDQFTSRIEPIFNAIKENRAEIKSMVALQSNYLALLSR